MVVLGIFMSTKYFWGQLPSRLSPALTPSLILVRIAIGGIAIGGLQLSQAQTVTPKEDSSTILVSGSRFEENSNRIPANVKVISREEIEQSSSNNIPEILSQLGGLIVRGASLGQLGLGATVDMGGFGASATSNTLVLVDGQRLTPIDSATVPWNSVPMSSIERIEIIQGGGSVQYGNNAVGGVINIITKDSGKEINQVSTKIGSFGTSISDVILSQKMGDTSLRITANTSHTQGWRENSAAHSNGVGGTLNHSFGALDRVFIEAYANHSNNQFPGGVIGEVGQGNPRSVKFNNKDDYTQQEGSRLRAGAVKSLGLNALFEGEVAYSDQTVKNNRPYYSGSLYSSSYSLITKSQFDVTPRIKLNWGNWGDSMIGFDFNESKSNYGDNLNGLQSIRQLNRSVYLSQRMPLIEKVDLTGGFRRQNQDITALDFQATSGQMNANQSYSANAGDLALNYRYASGQKLYLKWNQSFRFANTDEYWGWDPITGNRQFSGVNIKPQISQTYELGGDWRLGKAKLSAAIFQTDTKDEIRYDPVNGVNINDQNIRRRGISLDGSFSASANLILSSGGKFQRSYYTNGDDDGKTISLVPDWSWYGRVNYRFDPSLQFGGIINVVGNQYYDGDKSNMMNQMPASAFADLYVEYLYQSWETRLTVKNIGDSKYSTYGGYSPFVSTAPGVYGPSYYYYPSDPRALYLTVKYNFSK
jgi:iron complex outermembrane receptor protein